MGILNRISRMVAFFRNLEKRIEKIQSALGRIEMEQLRESGSQELGRHEVSVFSQWGEDGILEYIFRNITLPNHLFVEFGVENYREANTRFLLTQKNWSGLVMDGSAEHIQSIKKEDLYWRHSLTAKHAFITRENINDLISDSGIRGDIGLLSIDIDGNDYWVWESIRVVNPAVVVIEYNHRFGPARAVTIPYQPDFVRTRAHHSTVYYGASLSALVQLGTKKGFAFVGCNTAGNNAFFVRKDLMKSPLREITAEEGFVQASFREARDENGTLSSIPSRDEAALLSDLPLVEVT